MRTSAAVVVVKRREEKDEKTNILTGTGHDIYMSLETGREGGRAIG